MNLDERMQLRHVKIASVHSSASLAQLVEAGQASERRIDKLTVDVDKLTGHMTKLTVTMDKLANIVIRHEERLDSLDGAE